MWSRTLTLILDFKLNEERIDFTKTFFFCEQLLGDKYQFL